MRRVDRGQRQAQGQASTTELTSVSSVVETMCSTVSSVQLTGSVATFVDRTLISRKCVNPSQKNGYVIAAMFSFELLAIRRKSRRVNQANVRRLDPRAVEPKAGHHVLTPADKVTYVIAASKVVGLASSIIFTATDVDRKPRACARTSRRCWSSFRAGAGRRRRSGRGTDD